MEQTIQMSVRDAGESELRLYLHFLQRWWPVLLLAGVVAAAIGFAVSQMLTPAYAASTTLLVGRPLSQTRVLTQEEITVRDVLAKNYAEMAMRRPILEASAAALNLNVDWRTLQKRITITPQEGMQLLDVTAEGETPGAAEALAAVVGNQLIAVSRNQLTLFSAAEAEPTPIRPNVLMLTLLAGLLGFMTMGAVLVVHQMTDATMRSADDLYTQLGLRPLATIHTKHRRGRVTAPINSAPAEEYRLLRSALQPLVTKDRLKTILVTSAHAGEGKSTVAVNLAVSLARAHYHTVLIDANFGHAQLHQAFGLTTNKHGLLQLLANPQAPTESMLQQSPVVNLQLLTSGESAGSAVELLGSPRMQQLLTALADHADIVIIDGPPVLETADAVTLGGLLDGVIFVIRHGRTPLDAIQRALFNLRMVQATVLGGVLNQSR